VNEPNNQSSRPIVQITESLEHHERLEFVPSVNRATYSSQWKDLVEEMSIRSTVSNGHSTNFEQTLDLRMNFLLGLVAIDLGH